MANVQAPDKVKAVQLLNVSLRALHVSKQPALARPLIAGFQTLLRETPAGQMFFDSVAKPEAIKNVLSQAYYDSDTVTDELVDCLLQPGLQPGAARVFLDFIRWETALFLLWFWLFVCSRAGDSSACDRLQRPEVLLCRQALKS